MKDVLKVTGIAVIVVASLIGLSYGFGWVGVHQKATIGKAMQNVDREVFEESNSFTKAKRQEAIKYYREYLQSTSEDERQAIKVTIGMSLADFDEDRFIDNRKLLEWIKDMKY